MAEFGQGLPNSKQKEDALYQIESTQPKINLYKPLTKTEIKVLHLILDGKGNKEIARILYRSVRTIEVHRWHIMRKMNVNNLVDLVKRAASMGLLDLP